jgi:hypothetical protein
MMTAPERNAAKRELDALRQRVRAESQAAKRQARKCNRPTGLIKPKGGEVWP